MIPKYKMEWFVGFGFSNRQIAQMTGESKSNVQYTIQKYGLGDRQKYQQRPSYDFEKIDDPGKAYALGFILCESNINIKKHVSLRIAERDKCVIEFISKIINSEPHVSYETKIEQRKFPSASTSKKINDILKFVGGFKKEDRHYPRVREDLELYLLLGVFDADGCITWGRRKDRNRIWQKISFTSQYGILYGVQQVLLKKLQIATAIHPKSGENCYVLEFADRENVLKFLDWLYQNPYAVVLPRKYEKYRALRLELEGNGEGRDRHE